MGSDAPASAQLSVSLVVRPDGPVRRIARWVVATGYLVVVAASSLVFGPTDGGGGPGDLFYSADVVVQRRDTGAELLRTRATARDEAQLLLAHLREQLAQLPVDQFCQRWGIAWPL